MAGKYKKNKKGLSAFLCPGWQQHQAHRRSTPMGERWLERSDEIPWGNVRGVIHQNQPPLAGLRSSYLTNPLLSISLFVTWRDKMTGCRERAGIKPLFRRNEPVSELRPIHPTMTASFLILAHRPPINCNKPFFDFLLFFFFLSLSSRPRLSVLRSLLGKYLQSSSNKSSLSRGVSIWV